MLWEEKPKPTNSYIESTIHLNRFFLSKEEQEGFNLFVKYGEASSIKGEIGTCPDIHTDLQVIEKSPVLIRPFHHKEEGKSMTDKQMQRLVHLGILKQNMWPYLPPIILIARKNLSLKRIITDFRFLNSRLQRVNFFPLIRDAFAVLQSSKCECLSLLDLKDAYHTLKLSERSKPYCGVLSYFSSASHVYQRMPSALCTDPAIWQSYSSIPYRSRNLAIMDDLLLHSSKQGHLKHLKDLLKALLKSVKILPNKYQLFRTELKYMGYTIFIKDNRICIKPLKTRLEAIKSWNNQTPKKTANHLQDL